MLYILNMMDDVQDDIKLATPELMQLTVHDNLTIYAI